MTFGKSMTATCPECSAALVGSSKSCPHCGWTSSRRSRPVDAVPPKKKVKWWLWTILSPFLALVAGILVAIALGQHQDDWLGMRAIAPIMFGLLVGCALSCVFAIVSLEKREERSTVAFIAAIPCGLFVAFAILGLLGFLK